MARTRPAAPREGRPEPKLKRPLSVGFWFSLGHSTIVFTLALLLSAGVKALAGQVEDDGSQLHSMTNGVEEGPKKRTINGLPAIEYVLKGTSSGEGARTSSPTASTRSLPGASGLRRAGRWTPTSWSPPRG